MNGNMDGEAAARHVMINERSDGHVTADNRLTVSLVDGIHNDNNDDDAVIGGIAVPYNVCSNTVEYPHLWNIR